MPSFFYHVAFDLNHAARPNNVGFLKSSHTGAPHVTGPDISHIQRTYPSERPVQAEDESIPHQSDDRALSRDTVLTRDWRYDQIKVQNINMVPEVTGSKSSSQREAEARVANGIAAGHGGLATKGRFEPLNHDEEDIGWGVVRLFRDAEETPGLYDDTVSSKNKGGRGISRKGDGEELRFRDDDCTTLCVLAVPSYLTPSDFLGFVGEKTRDEVSHFRMIRTERSNRYMVLMKFRSGKKAREWRKEWNGKPFDSMEVSA
ncbi:MAG: hypothetical protein Q9225_002213 [Loekoesia sp. 1 TL-2023]